MNKTKMKRMKLVVMVQIKVVMMAKRKKEGCRSRMSQLPLILPDKNNRHKKNQRLCRRNPIKSMLNQRLP